MPRVAAILLAMILATSALAQGRPSSVALTCRESAALVQARGAVVLGTGGYTYDRYVSDRRFCEITEQTRQAFVPTRDTPACFVGYTCFEPSRRDAPGDF